MKRQALGLQARPGPVALGVPTDGCGEVRPCTEATGDDGLVRPLAAEVDAALMRQNGLAGARKARHGEGKVDRAVADDEDGRGWVQDATIIVDARALRLISLSSSAALGVALCAPSTAAMKLPAAVP